MGPRNMLRASRVCGFAAIVVFMLAQAAAHEFWLEPADFAPKLGETVPINIFIGQNFKGDSFPFGKDEFKKFVVIDARGEKPVKGIDGDDPAVTMKFQTPGLNVFAHYSTPESLVMDWDLFAYYLKLEGLTGIEERHKAENKPMSKIKEIYSRCAKLLMSVGAGGGADKFTGMPLELVAEKNPFALAPGETLPVRLLRDGKPLADIQIAAMAKAEPEKRRLVRTDAQGRAEIDVSLPGPWLLNAVHMTEPGPKEKAQKADWTSLWASLTFARP